MSLKNVRNPLKLCNETLSLKLWKKDNKHIKQGLKLWGKNMRQGHNNLKHGIRL